MRHAANALRAPAFSGPDRGGTRHAPGPASARPPTGFGTAADRLRHGRRRLRHGRRPASAGPRTGVPAALGRPGP